MPFLSGPDRRRVSQGLWQRIWAALVLGWWLSWTQAAEVSALRAERVDEGIYLTANLQLEIPPAVEDALTKGIALIFVAEAEIVRERWYWTDKRVAAASRSMRLVYQPLTRRWRLSQASSDPAAQGGRANLTQSFTSLADAVAALESIARWRIADAADIEAGASYLLSFRFRLDAGQLPRPFQIGIAGQRDWQVMLEQRQPLRLSTPEPRP
jgi:hypothetical protein